MNLNSTLLEKLKETDVSKTSVSQVLYEIQKFHAEDLHQCVLSMMYLKAAFGLPHSKVIAIAGWHGFGGELSDDEIGHFVNLDSQLE